MGDDAEVDLDTYLPELILNNLHGTPELRPLADKDWINREAVR